MIASNIICRGVSRFLNTIYCQDIQVSGTASLSSLSLSGNLSVTGTSTLTGNTTVGGTLGVTGGATFSGHVTINGSTHFRAVELYDTTPYIDFHYNNSTADYTSRIIESSSGTLHIAQNLTIASTISAPTGIIPTFNSTNVNVTNNLRANHYDLQTVAQLGGSFYVSPTVKFPNSGTTLKVEKSGSTLTLTITDSSITSTTMAGVVWTAGSGVKVSGTINGVVTGTMDGTVSSINTSSHVLTLSVSGENSANVVAGTYNASQFKDLSVMLYTRKQDGTSKMINTASGAIASFTDGGNNVPVKQLVVDIEPVQDLHGQDNPYPAGGGRNKFIAPTTGTSAGITYTKNSNGTFTVNGTATGYSYRDATGTLKAGSYILTGGGNNVNLHVRNADTDSAIAISNTAGSGASFTLASDTSVKFRLQVNSGASISNLTVSPMIRLSSDTDTTFAPYSNICPISGHTQAKVTRTGKNLFNGVYGYHNTDRTISVIAGTTLTLSSKSTGAKQINGQYYYSDNTWGGDFLIVASGSTYGSITKTIPSNAVKMAVYVADDPNNNNHIASDTQVEIGSTATAYEPYKGNTYTIDLNGTRYGGTLDVTSGVLTVTHTYVDVNAFGSVSSGTSAGGLHWVDTTTAVFDADKVSYCSMLTRKNGDVGWLSTSPCYSMGADKKVRIYCGESTTALFKSAYADLQIVCGSISPTTVQLSHTEVRTLSGYNNIWSNTGDTNVIYESSQVDSTNNYNVGIWMNCYDQANSSSTIRVYNGSSRWPNVFLGNMTNADLPRVNGNEPYGYGLYSDNVFLRGIISATGGLIGNWTIGTTGMFYNSDAPGSTSITMIPGGTTASTTSIGGSSGSKSWIFTGKNLFGIDTTGKLYASSAVISGDITANTGYIGGTSGWTIASQQLSSGEIGQNNSLFLATKDLTSTTPIGARPASEGTDWRFTVGSHFGVTNTGVLYASSVHISGTISASSGTIGGVTANSSYGLYTNGKSSALSTKEGFLISKDGAIYLGAYNSTNGACPFQVTSAGALTATSGKIGGWTIGTSSLYNTTNSMTSTGVGLYLGTDGIRNYASGTQYVNITGGKITALGVDVSGKIAATSGAIAGWRIESTYLASGTATAPAANTLLLSPAGTTSSYTIAGTAKSGWMITAGTTFGVNKDGGVYATSGKIGPWHVTTTSIYKGSNSLGSTTSGAAYFGDLGLSVGNKFKVDASGDGAIILGELAEGKTHIEVDSDSFDICSGATTGDNAVKLATFGEITRIGNGGSNNVLIDAGGFSFTNTDGDEMMKISTDNVVIGKDGSSYFYVDSNSIILKDKNDSDVFKVESGGGSTITNSDYERYTHKFTNTQVQNGVSIRVNHSNIKSAPTNITVAFWKRYAYTVIVNGETKTLYEDRIFSRVALGSRYYTSTYVENEYGKININSDGVTQINSWIDNRYNSGETIKFDIMFNYTWQSNTYSNLNMNGNMVVTDSIASDEIVATTSVTSGDFVFGANGMSINEMQQASAAPTITSSNKIDSTPAIGAQLTLYSGVYLLVANGNFNSGSSSGQRINQIAIYTGINPTNANIITSSRVRVVNAGSYWSSLSTQIIVTVPSNTGQTFTVGLTSSIAQSAASSTLLQAVFLRPPSS